MINHRTTSKNYPPGSRKIQISNNNTSHPNSKDQNLPTSKDKSFQSNNKIAQKPKMGTNISLNERFSSVSENKYCPQGVEDCIYNVCDGKGRPLYGFEHATSCGRFHATEFCNHPFCHDERLKLAKGDNYALQKQRFLNKTGTYSQVPPINYQNINGRIMITKELKESCYKPEIMHINWKDKNALFYMKKDKSQNQQKPFLKSKINHFLPPISTSLSFLLQSMYQNLNRKTKYLKRRMVHHINYPNDVLTFSNFFYISLLLLALFTPITKGEERITQNFIYELIDDEILLNNQYLFTAKNLAHVT